MREIAAIALVLLGCNAPAPIPAPTTPPPTTMPSPPPTPTADPAPPPPMPASPPEASSRLTADPAPPPPMPASPPEASSRLRITEPALYRITPAKQRERVAEHAVLHSRDHIQIDVVADRTAYIYVLQKNGKGVVDVIAPAPDEGLLVARPDVVTTIPDAKVGYDIELDDDVGNDTLFVVVSVSPLEISLDDSDAPNPANKPAPKVTKPRVLVQKPAGATGGPAALVGRSNGWTPKGARRTPKQAEKFKLEVEATDSDDVIVRAVHYRHE